MELAYGRGYAGFAVTNGLRHASVKWPPNCSKPPSGTDSFRLAQTRAKDRPDPTGDAGS